MIKMAKPADRDPSTKGSIRRRLALAIVLTALIPLLVSILVASYLVRATAQRFYRPEVGEQLDRSLDLYQELARAVKTSMRHEATAIAADSALRKAVADADAAAVRRELDRLFVEYPNLVSLSVSDAAGKRIAGVNREQPLDPARENKLEVLRPLAAGSEPAEEDVPGDLDGVDSARGVPMLTAVFAADKARFDELNETSQFVDTYKKIERERERIEPAFLYMFALLLGITILLAIGVGSLLARNVSVRIGELAEATKRVGAGDLAIRVPEDGHDEIADLATAFNRMLGEVESSRARIEYLQRIGAWQEMARRLAHEIKNPLTPIQLAVQEIHRRYRGEDTGYKKLVDTTLEIVEDEVGTLRRLVSEFSDFARLPQAELKEADLAEFLREQTAHLSRLDEEPAEGSDSGVYSAEPPGAKVQVGIELMAGKAPVCMDRQMLRRALINLVRNAAQAIKDSGRAEGKVEVRLERQRDYFIVDIDDDGPGIPPEMRSIIFDPYVTTKTDGSGLGLAIVKKIVVEHGGSISAEKSPLGGARMHLRLPVAGTPAASAAFASRDRAGPPSSRRQDALMP
jgi:two-component system, NtrC family, nitrogen regulation sensor histidine kinase NtrY